MHFKMAARSTDIDRVFADQFWQSHLFGNRADVHLLSAARSVNEETEPEYLFRMEKSALHPDLAARLRNEDSPL